MPEIANIQVFEHKGKRGGRFSARLRTTAHYQRGAVRRSNVGRAHRRREMSPRDAVARRRPRQAASGTGHSDEAGRPQAAKLGDDTMPKLKRSSSMQYRGYIDLGMGPSVRVRGYDKRGKFVCGPDPIRWTV